MKYSYKYLEDEWSNGYQKFIENNPDKNWHWPCLSKKTKI